VQSNQFCAVEETERAVQDAKVRGPKKTKIIKSLKLYHEMSNNNAKIHQIRFILPGRAYSTPPDSLAWYNGDLVLRERSEREGREGIEMENREGKKEGRDCAVQKVP